MQVLLIKKDVYSTCLTEVTKQYLKRDTVLSKNLQRATEVLVLYNKLLLANIIRQYKLSSVWYVYKLIVTRFFILILNIITICTFTSKVMLSHIKIEKFPIDLLINNLNTIHEDLEGFNRIM